MSFSSVIEEMNENPHQERSFYEYPALYDFYHSWVLNKDAQINLLKQIEPDNTNRVLEFAQMQTDTKPTFLFIRR